ncbi:N-acetylmuramoyl-L-alanine amidase family protein [Lentilactobacillus hilgardii]|uniref:N-acetylmuramoyl-L-alanine amidase family protein n=1 Tax=Lentilactobacillus hilgardii TaxID=1588 RepID=UPI00390CACD4|nr:hypothetical protein [Lentilactobacillus hilgardii]
MDRNDKGIAVTGKQEINGQTYYFNADGKQVKNDFKELPDGSWLYLNDKGIAVTGKQEINGQTYYFNADGKQVKENIVKNPNGTINYYEGKNGRMLKNDFGELPNGSWVYLDNNGDAVTGEQIIRGKKMCFMSDGIQVKGKSVLGSDGKYHYYDANSGVELS